MMKCRVRNKIFLQPKIQQALKKARGVVKRGSLLNFSAAVALAMGAKSVKGASIRIFQAGWDDQTKALLAKELQCEAGCAVGDSADTLGRLLKDIEELIQFSLNGNGCVQEPTEFESELRRQCRSAQKASNIVEMLGTLATMQQNITYQYPSEKTLYGVVTASINLTTRNMTLRFENTDLRQCFITELRYSSKWTHEVSRNCIIGGKDLLLKMDSRSQVDTILGSPPTPQTAKTL